MPFLCTFQFKVSDTSRKKWGDAASFKATLQPEFLSVK